MCVLKCDILIIKYILFNTAYKNSKANQNMHFLSWNKSATVIVLIFIGLLLFAGFQFHKNQTNDKVLIHSVPNNHNTRQHLSNQNHHQHLSDSKNILDGCYHVYLDVGSNIGIQVRKLYEPEKYPDAYVHSIFNSQFGSIDARRKASLEEGRVVCAVGFEPNSHHTEYLTDIEHSYNKCGWNVKFMTETGVSDHTGMTRFYSDEAYEHMEWGGGILPPDVNSIAIGDTSKKDKPKFKNVTLVRLSDFLKNVVGTGKLPVAPSADSPPKVVMKMDIEGSEVDVMPDLIFSGGLQYIDSIILEWHERFEKSGKRKEAQRLLESIIKSLSDYSKTMKGVPGGKFNFNLVNLDDETYHKSKFDLPNC